MARPPGADNPANVIAAYRIYNEQVHAARSADRLIPALAVGAGVDYHEHVWVIENLSRSIEVHSMLFEVSASLNGIPFEFHTPMLYGIAVGRYPRSLTSSSNWLVFPVFGPGSRAFRNANLVFKRDRRFASVFMAADHLPPLRRARG
jgi:hypothetical protein